MKYSPTDGRWTSLPSAEGLKQVQKLMDEQTYEQNKEALKLFLCAYFSTGKCTHKQGKSISPIGSTPKGGKILKVRWGLPGQGKSGGLRLAVVAYCEEKRVVIADAFLRNTDPDNDDFFSAVQSLP
ncbi:MAG: hypothetical protein AAF892_08005 [Cyanobacteria bacterium P01_D01_bin.71]